MGCGGAACAVVVAADADADADADLKAWSHGGWSWTLPRSAAIVGVVPLFAPTATSRRQSQRPPVGSDLVRRSAELITWIRTWIHNHDGIQIRYNKE